MGIYEVIKDAVSIAQKADNIDLIKTLLDVQKESLELLEENRELKQQIRELKDISNIGELIIYKNNCYFKNEDIELKEPYCSNCWDNDKKLIRMHTVIYYEGNGLTGVCPTCKTTADNILKKY